MPRVRRIVDPLLATYYSVPVFVLYPLFIVLFGLNAIPKTVIGFLYAVVAMVINTLNGLDRVPAVFWKTAKVYQLSRTGAAIHIVFPCAGPYLFTGAKLAVVYSFIGVIGSEFILSSGGLGYRISFAYNNFQSDVMYGLILFVLLRFVLLGLSGDPRFLTRFAVEGDEFCAYFCFVYEELDAELAPVCGIGIRRRALAVVVEGRYLGSVHLCVVVHCRLRRLAFTCRWVVSDPRGRSEHD